MSSLSWIVFDEAERQRARRIMALFEEKDTRDELGLGAIRDSIADHLFPGTSTIQTRLRYMLFVPWIYRLVENIDAPPDQLTSMARDYEIRLIEALRAGGEEQGVIGRFAGARLQRLPSSVYWNGLNSWGIRRFIGPQETYFDFVTALSNRQVRGASLEDDSSSAGRNHSAWIAGFPASPPRLLEQTNFQLTGDEAGFLIDRLTNAQPECLLTHLAKSRRCAECEYVWLHPDLADFPPRARRLVEHADLFSAVMHGAALLYNLMLAEERNSNDWIERYRAALSAWRTDEFDGAATRSWSIPEFWEHAKHENHRVRGRTRKFVETWVELVIGKNGEVDDLDAARDLVRNRERALKRSQSRFDNRTVRDKWRGESGTRRLSFRWQEANSHIRDLANAD